MKTRISCLLMLTLLLVAPLMVAAQEPKNQVKLTGHTESIRSVVFIPDGKTLASASNDKTVILWDLKTGKKLTTLSGHNQSVNSIACTSKTIVSGSEDGTLRLWSLPAGKEIKVIEHGKIASFGAPVHSVAVSPDGKTTASTGSGGILNLWNLDKGDLNKALRTDASGFSSAVAFAPDGKVVATASGHESLFQLFRGIQLWNVAESKITLTMPHDGAVLCVAFNLDGKTIAAGDTSNVVKLWNVSTGKEMQSLKGHEKQVSCLAFAPNGKILATGSLDKKVILWDLTTGKVITTLKAHEGAVWTVAFSSDSKLLASGGSDKVILLWDLGSIVEKK